MACPCRAPSFPLNPTCQVVEQYTCLQPSTHSVAQQPDLYSIPYYSTAYACMQHILYAVPHALLSCCSPALSSPAVLRIGSCSAVAWIAGAIVHVVCMYVLYVYLYLYLLYLEHATWCTIRKLSCTVSRSAAQPAFAFPSELPGHSLASNRLGLSAPAPYSPLLAFVGRQLKDKNGEQRNTV